MVLTLTRLAPFEGDIREPYRSTANPSWRAGRAVDTVNSTRPDSAFDHGATGRPSTERK